MIAFLLSSFVVSTTALYAPRALEAVAAVELGTAINYAILAKAGISTVPTSAITGDIGVSPITAAAITGFALSPSGDKKTSTSAQVTGLRVNPGNFRPSPKTGIPAVGLTLL
jgi:hypothetical protein